MPTQDGFMTEAELDRLAIEQRGGTVPEQPLSAAEREKQRQESADRRNKALAREPDRKVGVERVKTARAALLSNVQSRMSHGVTVSDSEKKRIVSRIISDLGGKVPDAVAAGIRRYVDVSARAYRDGAPGPAWALADEAATAIANADFEMGDSGEADDELEMDPAKLAEKIGRM